LITFALVPSLPAATAAADKAAAAVKDQGKKLIHR